MPKFSEFGNYLPEFRKKEIEEFNLLATEESLDIMRKSMRLSRKTYIVAFLTLIISVVALIVALVK